MTLFVWFYCAKYDSAIVFFCTLLSPDLSNPAIWNPPPYSKRWKNTHTTRGFGIPIVDDCEHPKFDG